MNRAELAAYIWQEYDVEKECPWQKYPSYEVFRHLRNKKWFAVVMRISKDKVGLNSTEMFDVVNLKCDSDAIYDLVQEEGIFPAYHMNKKHWLTVSLEHGIADEKLKALLARSFELTK